MMTEKLITLLGSKLYDLKEKKEKEEKALEEIKQLKDIIKVIENNPFNLCDLDESHANYIADALSLGKDYFDKIKKYKVIYDGYVKFGRDAIPQIEIVEDFIAETKKSLNDRKFELTDEVADHQHTIVEFEEYGLLYEELVDADKEVSKLELLFKFLEGSTFDVEDKNKILLEINESNNSLFEKNLEQEESKEEITVEDIQENEYEIQIAEIQKSLSNEFHPATLNNLNSISKLLSSCKSKEEFDMIIDDWKFTFGDESIVRIIDALIDLKNIELLTINELSVDNLDDFKEDIETVNLQIQFLEEYKSETLTVNEMEKETIVSDPTLSKVEQALTDYNEDLLKASTHVLIINEGVDRDIKSITDTKTLEDVFIVIEQFKNGMVDKNKLMGAKDLEVIKTKSKGNEARVACVKLSDNTYGIINITDRKDESPRNWLKTLEARRKNSDVDNLRKTINDPEVLEYYVARTKDILGKLKNRVSSSYETKETVVTGGTK